MIEPDNRAPSKTVSFIVARMYLVTATVSYKADTGKPFQVFLRLHGATPEVQEMVDKFAISVSHALQGGATPEMIEQNLRAVPNGDLLAEHLVPLLKEEEPA